MAKKIEFAEGRATSTDTSTKNQASQDDVLTTSFSHGKSFCSASRGTMKSIFTHETRCQRISQCRSSDQTDRSRPRHYQDWRASRSRLIQRLFRGQDQDWIAKKNPNQTEQMTRIFCLNLSLLLRRNGTFQQGTF